MSRFAVLRKIQTLDPVADHQRIVHLSTCYDFPFDTTRSLEFALFRTFCVPAVSALLEQTGEFQARAQKRYDDTDILISALLEWGYESEKGKLALRRMNQMHGRFDIANADYLYVLSTFVFEPIRWNARYGWRRMCAIETEALFRFWREVGRRMGIREIPDRIDEFEEYNVDYERSHFRFVDSNAKIGAATVGVFTGWFPRMLSPLVRAVIYAMLEDPLIEAFGFPKPSRFLRWLVPIGLKARGRLAGMLPARTKPRLRTEMKRAIYPTGYRLEELGPIVPTLREPHPGSPLSPSPPPG